MSRPRVRSQLAIQAPPDLLERLRAAATAQRRTVTALVLEAIEAALSGAPAAAAPAAADPGGPSLLERVERLEVALAQLQQTPPVAPEPRPAAPPVLPAPLPPAAPGRRLTTTELADLTGTNRAAWNNWASPGRVGKVRRHPQAGRWRLVARVASPTGGPPRWVWEAV